MTRPYRTARLLLGAVVTLGAAAGTAGTAFAATPEPTGRILQEGAAGSVRDSYIVVLRTADQAQVASTAGSLGKRYGGAVRRNFTATVKGFSVTMSAAAARRLAANPAVAYVEQDRIVQLSGTQSNPTWGLDRLDQKALPLSKSYTSGSASNVTAYVLDTGVLTPHADFGGRARSGYDFIDSDAVANDCNGHGTHVAGTVGGSAYGVAKDVKLVGVKVLNCSGSGAYSQIIAGVDWVTKNAVKPAVANMSLGGTTSTALDDAVKRSIAAGITYALAAGNDNKDACTQSPARTPAAITVGASDSADARASFSNWGKCLDLFAPGAKILSTSKANATATTTMSGTSMASPHVAGAAALVLGANPTASPAQVRDALVNGATAGKVTGAGTGSPNLLLYTGVTPVIATPTPAPVATPAPTPTSAPTSAAPTTSAPAVTGCPVFTSTADVAIKDLTTVSSSQTVVGCAGTGSRASTVSVSVKHGHRGSLAITLVAPDLRTFALKTVTASDSTDDLNVTYGINTSTISRNGTWKLKITDSSTGTTGYLDAWTLKL
jgi:subtilisin family serine protease